MSDSGRQMSCCGHERELERLQGQIKGLEAKLRDDAKNGRKQFGVTGAGAWADGVEWAVEALAALHPKEHT